MNRINLICLGVRDMARSLEFYKNIGFKTHEEAANPPVVFFSNCGTKLELFPIERLAADICAENPPAIASGSFGGITLAINVKSREEVDAFMELAARHGASIAKEPQEVFWGGYSGYFTDPDGYYWEVAYADIWSFDENDMLLV